MKKYFFFPVFTLFLSLMLLVGCDRSDQPEPVGAAVPDVPAVPVGEVDLDGPLTFRTCGAVSTECIVTVAVTGVTIDFSICGMVYSSGSDFCDVDIACGEAKGYRETHSTSPQTFCMDHVYHPGLLITNNSSGSITIDITVTGGTGPQGVTIGANSSAEFEIDADCNVTQC